MKISNTVLVEECGLKIRRSGVKQVEELLYNAFFGLKKEE